MRRKTKTVVRWTVRLVPLALVVVGFGWLWTARTDVRAIPQSVLHDEATVSKAATMAVLPKMHKVVIEPVSDDRVVGVLASYLPPPLGAGGKSEIQGFYDPKDGHIEITGGLARLSAAMPVAPLRTLFYRDLRHEYGHAFLHDWTSARSGRDSVRAVSTQGSNKIDPESLPVELRAVAAEYRVVSPTIYGQQYFTSTFGEFVAESYARLLSGQEVPPATEKFLKTASAKQ